MCRDCYKWGYDTRVGTRRTATRVPLTARGGRRYLARLRRGSRGSDMDDMARMLSDIRQETMFTRAWLGKDQLDARVMAALAAVPRHAFLAANQSGVAYDYAPVPSGHGQTISQHFIGALMTDLLLPKPGDVVLEIGTGCGYQAAVLSRLVAQVYSVEIVPGLAAEAAARLARLSYHNVAVRAADGFEGWRARGPFDAIIVTAAVTRVPQPLLDQLRPGGRLVVPLGPPHADQMLTVLTRSRQGGVETRLILPLSFVPFTGAHPTPAGQGILAK